MAETSQSENVLKPRDRVTLNEAGRIWAHDRLSGCSGVLQAIEKGIATVVFDSVVMNSGSNERTQKNGPFVPRVRMAMSIIPLKYLEAE